MTIPPTGVQNQTMRRRLIRNQAIERALKKYFRKTLSDGFACVDVLATICDGLRVDLMTRHGTHPIVDLTTVVRQVLAGTKINMLRVKLNK